MTLDLHLVGGAGSSGTTLLAHVLDGLLDLRSGPELGAFHHRQLYSTEGFRRELYRAFTGRSEAAGVTIDGLAHELIPARFLCARDWYGIDGVETEYELLEAAEDLGELLAGVKRAMAATQAIEDAFGWIDHTPKNALCALEFLRAFPGSRFVHLVRDGRDVALSLARRYAREAPGHRPDTYLTIGLVRWTYDVTRALRARDEPGYLEVRYEELCTEPETTVNRILRHLGRPEVDAAELGARPSPTAERDPHCMCGPANRTWTLQPDRPIGTEAIGRWKHELPPELQAFAHRFRFAPPGEERTLSFGALLEELGYA